MNTIVDYLFLGIIRITFFITAMLPERTQVKFLTLFISTLLLFFPRSKYVTYRNLSICFPHYSTKDKQRIWKDSKVVLAKNVLGFLYGSKITKEEALTHLTINSSKQAAEDVKNNTGKGILVLVPHYGSFELLAQYWSLVDKPYAILARGFGLKHLDTWWNKKRGVNGNVVFSRKGGFNDIINYLNNGTNVAILFDQNVKRKHSIFVNFFGYPASTTKTIGLASVKTGCKILFTTMTPKNPEDQFDYKNYELVAHFIKSPHEREGQDMEKKIHDTIAEAHEHLERYIKMHPEYWFWIHRRFKTRPIGEPENLYDRSLFIEK